MGANIRAGTKDDIYALTGEWLFVDMGFASGDTSCGIATLRGRCQTVTFSGLVRRVIRNAAEPSTNPLNLVLEAPLSVAFNNQGNPTGRRGDRESTGTRTETRYWYTGAGPSMMIAAGHLLKRLADSCPKREIRLFEGFVSFKRSGAKSDHCADALALRAAVLDTTKGYLVSEDELKESDLDRLESAFAFAGMDFGIPVVIFPRSQYEQFGRWHSPSYLTRI